MHFHRTVKTAGLIKWCHCKSLFEDCWQRQRMGGCWSCFTGSLDRISRAQNDWFVLFYSGGFERGTRVSMGISAFSSLAALTGHIMIHLTPLTWKSSRDRPRREKRGWGRRSRGSCWPNCRSAVCTPLGDTGPCLACRQLVTDEYTWPPSCSLQHAWHANPNQHFCAIIWLTLDSYPFHSC